MARKKTSDGISLTEFRAWLQGVEEMQGPEWAPNAEQWRRIKAKFNDIVEEETSPAPAAAPVQQYRTGPTQSLPPAFQPAYAPGTMPAPPSAPQPLPQGMLSGLEARTKTPDIDSSNGYQSSLV